MRSSPSFGPRRGRRVRIASARGPAWFFARRSRLVRDAATLGVVAGSVLLLSSCIPLRSPELPVGVASLPSLSVNNTAVTEGSGGSVRATFTVTLSAATAKTVTVRYATANGTAAAPGDFTATTGIAKVTSGHKTTTIAVSVLGDRIVEPNETFSVKLSSATNATIAHGTGTGTITNDDPTPALSIGDVSMTEGNSGTTNAVFPVTLSAASSRAVVVSYATVDGSATAPSDFASTSGTLTFSPLSTTRTISVPVTGDTTAETDETFALNLSNPSNATIADGTGQATIVDDDVPTASMGDVSVIEGSAGTTYATFPVTLSGPTSHTVTLDYVTEDGSATAPSDYTLQMDTLTFSPGQSTKLVSVQVNGDPSPELDETFYVHLVRSVGATIADAFGQGTILNDDIAAPSLAIAAPAANEGNSGNDQLRVHGHAVGDLGEHGDRRLHDRRRLGHRTVGLHRHERNPHVRARSDQQTDHRRRSTATPTVETNETFTREPVEPHQRHDRRHRHRHRDHQQRRHRCPPSRSRHRPRRPRATPERPSTSCSPSRCPRTRRTRSPSTTPPSTARPPRRPTTPPQSGTLTFAPGQTNQQIAVLVNGDTAERDQRDVHGQPVEPDQRHHRRHRHRHRDHHQRRRAADGDHRRTGRDERGQRRHDQLRVHRHAVGDLGATR